VRARVLLSCVRQVKVGVTDIDRVAGRVHVDGKRDRCRERRVLTGSCRWSTKVSARPRTGGRTHQALQMGVSGEMRACEGEGAGVCGCGEEHRRKKMGRAALCASSVHIAAPRRAMSAPVTVSGGPKSPYPRPPPLPPPPPPRPPPRGLKPEDSVRVGGVCVCAGRFVSEVLHRLTRWCIAEVCERAAGNHALGLHCG
jgi:hypothetical protein